MTRDKTGESAAELMARLQQEPGFQARANEKAEARLSRVAINDMAAAPVIRSLAAAGFAIATLAELRRLHYPAAIPVLVDWLPLVQNVDVKQDIVRCLSVPYATPSAVAALLAEFRSSEDQRPEGLRWTIGNALAVAANDSVLDPIIELATNRAYGRAREMVVLALGNMRDERAVETVVGLLKDDEVAGHAVMALGTLHPVAARPLVEPFLKHRTAWIRQEAKKTIGKIDRQPGRRPR